MYWFSRYPLGSGEIWNPGPPVAPVGLERVVVVQDDLRVLLVEDLLHLDHDLLARIQRRSRSSVASYSWSYFVVAPAGVAPDLALVGREHRQDEARDRDRDPSPTCTCRSRSRYQNASVFCVRVGLRGHLDADLLAGSRRCSCAARTRSRVLDLDVEPEVERFAATGHLADAVAVRIDVAGVIEDLVRARDVERDRLVGRAAPVPEGCDQAARSTCRVARSRGGPGRPDPACRSPSRSPCGPAGSSSAGCPVPIGLSRRIRRRVGAARVEDQVGEPGRDPDVRGDAVDALEGVEQVRRDARWRSRSRPS